MVRYTRVFTVTPKIFKFLSNYPGALICSVCRKPIQLGDLVESKETGNAKMRRKHLGCVYTDSRPKVKS